MQLIQAKDYDDMSRKAANIISAQVILKPNCVLGLATGSTPLGTYSNLIDWYKKGDLDFSQVSSVNLDEYRGLPAEAFECEPERILFTSSNFNQQLCSNSMACSRSSVCFSSTSRR